MYNVILFVKQMSVLLNKIQQQKLLALTDQHGLGFANEESALALDEFLSTRSDAQLEINLGHICNNICSFCVSGHLTQQGLAKPVPVDPIKKVMQKAYNQGTRQVILLGGEPTIQKNFFPALEYAASIGFEKIIVFTNLVRGREPAFLQRVAAYPAVHWRVSIQGGDEATHDRVVKRPGAFKKIQQGLAWLCKNQQEVSINSCITTESADSIAGYAELLQNFQIKQLHLDMFRPSSAGRRAEEYALDLIPDYHKVATIID